uniref:Uncharacterized protein n=1 Tax=Cacopsylla melanoneura TaxID=428564 RepID=A0A8D8XB22_9HEMI
MHIILLVSVILVLAVSSSKCNPTSSLEINNVKPAYTSLMDMDIESCMDVPYHFKHLFKSIQTCSKQVQDVYLEIMTKVYQCQHKKDQTDINTCLIDLMRNSVKIAEQHKMFDKLIELNTQVIFMIGVIMKCVNQ